MNEDEKKIITLIVGMASYYQASLSDEAVKMYAADFEGYSFEALSAAYKEYRNDPKNKFSPLPSQIKEIINPKVDNRGAAADLAQRIIAAANKHDNWWAKYDTFQSEFMAELGEVAWNVVQKRGGWWRFCDQYFDSDQTAFSAQLRDAIEFEWTSNQSGNLRPMHELPEPKYAPSRFEQVEQLVGKEEAISKFLLNSIKGPGDA